jgi:hypothetical protein
MSKQSSFNELTKTSHAVWCNLAPGVDPASWAWLCRRMGQLTVEDFNDLREETKPKKLVLTLLETWTKSFFGQKTQVSDVPLVSVGPSGLGGIYQKEICLQSRQVSVLRGGQFSGTSRIDLRA